MDGKAGGRRASTTRSRSWRSRRASDRPGTLLLRLPVNRTPVGDLEFVGDGTFEPMTNVALTVTPSARGSRTQCIFDGYVLSWRLHLDRASISSTIDIWAQDAARLMNIDDHVAEWSGLTDGEVANAIFGSYGFTPADGNTDHDSPSHLPEGHTLVQRATDLQFLRGLARRGGKLCRVACTDTAGHPDRVLRGPVGRRPAGHPDLPGRTPTGGPSRRSTSTGTSCARPRWTRARWTSPSPGRTGTDVNTSTSGLGPARPAGLPDLPRGVLEAAPDDARRRGRAYGRATAVLAESGFFARCTGEADAERIGAILRVGDVVTIEGAGNLHSGNWLVWDVRHSFSLDSWKMAFTLVRNAMGPPGPGGDARIPGPFGHLTGAGGAAVTTPDDRALEDLLERLRTRFYGKYRGIVTSVDADDDAGQGAWCRRSSAKRTTGWCMPCVPYAGPNVGFAFLPEIGSGVWIEFEGGDVSYPIWVGGYWRAGRVPGRRGRRT